MSIQTGEEMKLLELFIVKHLECLMASVEDSTWSFFLLRVPFAVVSWKVCSPTTQAWALIPELAWQHLVSLTSPPHLSKVITILAQCWPARLHCCLQESVHAGAWRLLVRCSVKMFAIKSRCSYMVPIATDGVWTTYAPGNCAQTQTHNEV